MKRPSFQFYPADWKQNAKLRRCSEAARGAWMDVLCVLHDSDEYGVCRWPLDEIARAAGVPLRLLKELVTKEVLKGAPAGAACAAFIYTPKSGRKEGASVILIPEQKGPIWYSSRFVRDEYVRGVRAEHGKNYGGNDASPKAAPKPPLGVPPTSSSSSSPSGIDDDVDSAGAPSFYGHLQKIIGSTVPLNCVGFIPKWKEAGASEALIEETIRRGMAKRSGAPPNSLKYFESQIADAIAEANTPMELGNAKSTGNNKKSAHDSFGSAWASAAGEAASPRGD